MLKHQTVFRSIKAASEKLQNTCLKFVVMLPIFQVANIERAY